MAALLARGRLLAPLCLALLVTLRLVAAEPVPSEAPPVATPVVDPNIRPVQGDLPDVTPRTENTNTQQNPQPQTPPAAPPSSGTRDVSQTSASSAGSAASTVPLGGGDNATPASASSDLGELLSKNSAAIGVEVQRRSAISSDPRIRGYHVGQVVTYGDNGFFFPARPDLDTAISKFDPGTVRDLIIVKGPFSVRYGPGFSFLDIASADSPRYKDGFEVHGRTSAGYQTNGQRWDGLQAIQGGGKDWGFRATYNLLAGNDYRDGNGDLVGGSYNAQNTNFAVGFDLDECSKIEFKGLRVRQDNVEFPSLYFNIDNLDTEAYSVRYSLKGGRYFDMFTADVWYNTTVVDGSTRESRKQTFLNTLLSQQFSSDGFNRTIVDRSTTRVGEHSQGTRLAWTWGQPQKFEPTVTVGADFNYLSQGLRENIVYQQTSGPSLNTGIPILPGQSQTFTQNPLIPNTIQTDPGVFIDMTLPFTKRLKVNAGARFDWVHSRSDSRLITGDLDLFGPAQVPGGDPVNRTNLDPTVFSTDPTNFNTNRNFPLFAAYVNGDYRIDENLTALAGFGYAQRAPTPAELYSSGAFLGVLQQGLSRVIGDAQLRPETVKELDIGLRGDYGWFRSGVNGFYAWIDDYITFDLNRGNQDLNQVIYTNTDLAVLAGGELFGELDATTWLTPFANASYVQGRDLSHTDSRRPANLGSSRRQLESEALPGIPPLEIRSGLRFHEKIIRKPNETPKRPKWQIEFAARNVFAQNAVASSLGELPTPSFVVFDLRTYYQVTEKILLTAGVENFGDRFYREHLDPRAGNAYGDPLYRPGFNFYFGSQITY